MIFVVLFCAGHFDRLWQVHFGCIHQGFPFVADLLVVVFRFYCGQQVVRVPSALPDIRPIEKCSVSFVPTILRGLALASYMARVHDVRVPSKNGTYVFA